MLIIHFVNSQFIADEIIIIVFYIQVSRAAVEGYTGAGEPPCIVMTLTAVSNETTPPDLSLPVTLTGLDHFQPSVITLKRKGELPVSGYEFTPKVEHSEATGQ